MLESHGNISILLSDVHELLWFSTKLPQTWFWMRAAVRMRAKQTERNEEKWSAMFLDRNVTMLECNMILYNFSTLYISLYGYIHFI